VTQGHAFRRLLLINMVLTFVLGVTVIALIWTLANFTQRRNVTVDALHIDAVRQECVDRTEVDWMRTLTNALLMPPDSPEQAVAIQKLVPIAEELRTVEERCYDENPLPAPASNPPVPTEGASTGTSDDGRDGMDGADGRAGRDGRDGSDGIDGTDATGTDGAPGEDGKDGAPGPAGPAGPPGVDGTDGVNGVDGVEGPQGPQGEQGFPGFDGAPPVGWWIEGQFCSDPDADLIYECAEVGA
jgi:hypothetical protein